MDDSFRYSGIAIFRVMTHWLRDSFASPLRPPARPMALKEPVEEDLCLTFFVNGDVLRAPGGEFGQPVGIRHGAVLPERKQGSNREF